MGKTKAFANKKELAYAGESSVPTLKMISSRNFGAYPNTTYSVSSNYKIYLYTVKSCTSSWVENNNGSISFGGLNKQFDRVSAGWIQEYTVMVILTDWDYNLYYRFDTGYINLIFAQYTQYNEVSVKFESKNSGITSLTIDVLAM